APLLPQALGRREGAAGGAAAGAAGAVPAARAHRRAGPAARRQAAGGRLAPAGAEAGGEGAGGAGVGLGRLRLFRLPPATAWGGWRGRSSWVSDDGRWAMRTTAIMLVGLLVAAGVARSEEKLTPQERARLEEEAMRLNRQVMQLYRDGRLAEAAGVAARALEK